MAELSVAGYMQGLSERRIAASRCGGCGGVYVPPRPICPACGPGDMTAEDLSGRGRVVGITSITIAPSAMAAKGYGRKRPYVTGVIALDEGPGLTARIELSQDDGLRIEDRVGMPVVADFEEEGEGDERSVTLVFRPA